MSRMTPEDLELEQALLHWNLFEPPVDQAIMPPSERSMDVRSAREGARLLAEAAKVLRPPAGELHPPPPPRSPSGCSSVCLPTWASCRASQTAYSSLTSSPTLQWAHGWQLCWTWRRHLGAFVRDSRDNVGYAYDEELWRGLDRTGAPPVRDAPLLVRMLLQALLSCRCHKKGGLQPAALVLDLVRRSLEDPRAAGVECVGGNLAYALLHWQRGLALARQQGSAHWTALFAAHLVDIGKGYQLPWVPPAAALRLLDEAEAALARTVCLPTAWQDTVRDYVGHARKLRPAIEAHIAAGKRDEWDPAQCVPAMLAPLAGRRCAHCSQAGTSKICSGCKCVRYCTAACQKAQWPSHRALCKQMPNYAGGKAKAKSGSKKEGAAGSGS
eukprot:scaffold1.g5525.t1